MGFLDMDGLTNHSSVDSSTTLDDDDDDDNETYTGLDVRSNQDISSIEHVGGRHRWADKGKNFLLIEDIGQANLPGGSVEVYDENAEEESTLGKDGYSTLLDGVTLDQEKYIFKQLSEIYFPPISAVLFDVVFITAIAGTLLASVFSSPAGYYLFASVMFGCLYTVINLKKMS